jgi:HEAT repeat protein
MRRKRMTAGLLLLVAVGALLGLRAAGARRFQFAFDWPAGMRDRYALRWTSRDRAALPGMESLTGELALGARLELTSLGRRDDVFWLEAKLAEVRADRIELMGAAVLGDPAAVEANLVGPSAWVEIEPNGRVRSIRFAPATPDLFRHLMSGLFAELQLELPNEEQRAEWTATTTTTHGVADVVYRADDATHLSVRRTGYRTLLGLPDGAGRPRPDVREQSSGQVALDRRGFIARLTEREHLEVTVDGTRRIDAELALTLEHLGRDRPAAAAAELPAGRLEVQRPGELTVGAETERRLLAQRVAGLTFAQMERDLLRYANDGRMPDDHVWFSRASGLVLAEPERAAALAQLFSAAHFNSKGRRLILDVLAAAGHPEAQAALRKALLSPEARRDPAYTMMVQRLALVQRPEPATAEFLDQMRRSSDVRAQHELHMASAFSLGAAAAHLAATGHESDARRFNAALAAELTAATDRVSRGELLRALGNVGSPENRPLLLRELHAEDPDLRIAVARALHKDDSVEAQRALVELAQDPSPSVQQAALTTLLQQTVTPSQVDALAGVVARDAIGERNHALAATILARSLELPAAVDGLRHLRDHTDDGNLRARIGSILMTHAL